jgi:hypothetical protein
MHPTTRAAGTHLCISQVHAVQVARPNGRLISSRTSSNLKHTVALIQGVPACTSSRDVYVILIFLRDTLPAQARQLDIYGPDAARSYT